MYIETNANAETNIEHCKLKQKLTLSRCGFYEGECSEFSQKIFKTVLLAIPLHHFYFIVFKLVVDKLYSLFVFGENQKNLLAPKMKFMFIVPSKRAPIILEGLNNLMTLITYVVNISLRIKLNKDNNLNNYNNGKS